MITKKVVFFIVCKKKPLTDVSGFLKFYLALLRARNY